jgi:hypothetical protein
MGRVILLRRGMLAWATTYNHVQASSVPSRQGCGTAVPTGVVANELVQVMAGLILSKRRDICLN